MSSLYRSSQRYGFTSMQISPVYVSDRWGMFCLDVGDCAVGNGRTWVGRQKTVPNVVPIEHQRGRVRSVPKETSLRVARYVQNRWFVQVVEANHVLHSLVTGEQLRQQRSARSTSLPFHFVLQGQ